MKKLILVLFVLLGSFTLLGCNTSEFKVDGEFTAFKTSVHTNGAMMVTMVSVMIKDGQIVSYNIDARQGTRTQTAGADTPDVTTDDTYTFAWNAKTKKELGTAYNMVTYGGAIAEWFVQAGRIEAYWLANGVDSVTVDETAHTITNVAGVSIKDGGYIALAQEAVELAKLGKFQAIYCTSTDLYIASMTVEKGEISELMLDVLQKKSVLAAANTFEWNDQTKQERGTGYAMKGVGAKYTFADGVWTSSATDKTVLEWYEQANLITNYIMETGNLYGIRSVDGRGIFLTADAPVDACAGVSIKTDGYITVLNTLFANVAAGELK